MCDNNSEIPVKILDSNKVCSGQQTGKPETTSCCNNNGTPCTSGENMYNTMHRPAHRTGHGHHPPMHFHTPAYLPQRGHHMAPVPSRGHIGMMGFHEPYFGIDAFNHIIDPHFDETFNFHQGLHDNDFLDLPHIIGNRHMRKRIPHYNTAVPVHHPDLHVHNQPMTHRHITPFTKTVPRFLPRVDVSDNGKELCIDIELPGIKKDRIQLKLNEHEKILEVIGTPEHSNSDSTTNTLNDNSKGNNNLNSSSNGNVQGATPVEPPPTPVDSSKSETAPCSDVVYHVKERLQGVYERALKLPANVALDTLTASFDHGLLKIRLCKINDKHGANDSEGEKKKTILIQ